MLALVPLLFVALAFVTVGGPAKVQIIDKHGRPLPNIFYGASRDSRVAFELSGRAAAGRTSDRPCLVRKVVYRQSEDPGRLVEVQGRCAGHYFVSEYRDCEAYCGGGVEQWVYSDSLLATYCDGYTYDYTGCGSGQCFEEFTCFGCF